MSTNSAIERPAGTPVEELKRLVVGLFPAMKFTPLLAEAWLLQFSWANDVGLHGAIRRVRAADLTARELSPERVAEELRQAGFVPPAPAKREIARPETRVIVDVISHMAKWSHPAAKELVDAYRGGSDGATERRSDGGQRGEREMREVNVLIWHAYWMDFDGITRGIDSRYKRVPEMVTDQLRGLWDGLGTLAIVGTQTMQQRQAFQAELSLIALRLDIAIDQEASAALAHAESTPF